MKTAAVIPARYGSTRLPGKPLRMIAGKPLVQHVYEAAARAGRISQVLVATDDERIANAVKGFGGMVMMTDPSHCCGTDRVAEAACALDAEIIVNLQGDEPLVDPSSIDQVVAMLGEDGAAEISTLCSPITKRGEFRSLHVVKVVFDSRGYALYFSRLPIPYRGRARLEQSNPFGYRHIGIYGYRRRALLMVGSIDPVTQEQAEGLEQLRPLVLGVPIKVAVVNSYCCGVDTMDELRRARNIFSVRIRRRQQQPCAGSSKGEQHG